MIALIQEKRPEIETLCRRYGVSVLEVFGSAATGEFDPTRSDLDFLVEFAPLPPGTHADSYFGLWEDLEKLLGFSVDLVERQPIRNPYFLESVNATKEPIYAA